MQVNFDSLSLLLDLLSNHGVKCFEDEPIDLEDHDEIIYSGIVAPSTSRNLRCFIAEFNMIFFCLLLGRFSFFFAVLIV